jgi:hypothetical protein
MHGGRRQSGNVARRHRPRNLRTNGMATLEPPQIGLISGTEGTFEVGLASPCWNRVPTKPVTASQRHQDPCVSRSARSARRTG